MAFSSRLLSAVISSVRSPSTSSPDGRSTVISMPADSADSRDRASASFTSSSTSTARQLGQPLGAGQPGQRDQLGDQRAEPRRLLEDPAGEAAHLGGVVRGVEHGLGQQPHRADGRLELVADVRDEVAPGGLQPHDVRAVGGLDDGEPVAEPADVRRARRRARGPGAPAATGRPRPATRSTGRTPPAGRPSGRADRRRRRRTTPSSTGARVVQHHLARAGQHGEPGVRRAEHAQQQVGEGRSGVGGGQPGATGWPAPPRRPSATPPTSPTSSATVASRSDASRLTAAS